MPIALHSPKVCEYNYYSTYVSPRVMTWPRVSNPYLDLLGPSARILSLERTRSLTDSTPCSCHFWITIGILDGFCSRRPQHPGTGSMHPDRCLYACGRGALCVLCDLCGACTLDLGGRLVVCNFDLSHCLMLLKYTLNVGRPSTAAGCTGSTMLEQPSLATEMTFFSGNTTL